MAVLNRLNKDLQDLQKLNLLRILKHENDLIDFCSNDYLGLSKNKELISKLNNETVNTLGTGGSRLLFGNTKKFQDLEQRLAKTHSTESALLFNSGYNANLSFFSTIPSRNDTVFFDEKIHTCIKDGIRLGHAKKVMFRHNDLAHLEQKLAQCIGEKFVAIESIYSMDGDMAPIHEIINICKKYGAHLVVDEAHSTGIIGDQGSGLVSSLGLDSFVFAKIHTFGKAIGSHGACVCSNQVVINYLINKARPFIFTTSMPEHNLKTISYVYSYLEDHYIDLQQKLKSNILLFQSLIDSKFSTNSTPIQIINVPGNSEAKEASELLKINGLDVRPVLSPTVPKGKERLRICLHTYNSSDQIEKLTAIINQSL